jgi:predicted dehydrogenase
MNRRSFLKKSALTLGGASVFAHPIISGTSASGQVLGANDRVRIAIAGAKSRGGEHIGFYGALENVEIAYIVDADNKYVDERVTQIATKTGKAPKGTQEYRVMLEDKDIDCVSIASPNHWHALQAIWACQAGKDVYLEKPCCQNLFEGRKLVEAAAKYKRLVQHGTQRRSEDTWARATAAVKSGKYGKLIAAKAYANRPRDPLGFKPITNPPGTIDWNQWLGPAPMQPFHENLAPYNWHWFWDTGNGEIGNNGPHYFDLCLWAMGETHPNSVISFGSRFVKDPKNHYRDQAETPTLHFALYDFNGIPVIYESCNIAGVRERWNPREEAEFYTENGIIQGNNFIPNGGGARQRIDVEFTRPHKAGFSDNSSITNCANFIDAVRNRNTVPLNAPIEKGLYAAALCHWGNAAYRTGHRETLTAIREKMGDNPILQASIEKVIVNLKDVFGDTVKIEDIPFKVSEKMAIDIEKEKFVNSPLGNSFLTRAPREPFAVPEQV